MTEESPDKKPRRRKIKEPTSQWLRQRALYYLDRFPATTMKMRQHLFTKARPGMEEFGLDEEELRKRIEAEIEKLVKVGFINDYEFAAGKARSMARQGKSTARIQLKLQELGFSEEFARRALEELGDDHSALDRRAAALYVRKRKFGPYKPPETRTARYEKEMASLARNGFSYPVARLVLGMETVEELEELIRDR